MSKNTVDQFDILSVSVARSLPRDLLGKDTQYWSEHEDELAQVLDRALRRTTEAKLLTVDYQSLPTLVKMPTDEHPADRDTHQIDLNKIELILTLKPEDDDRIGGEENLKRLKATGKRLLDVRVMEELLKRPELIPESWKEVGAVYFWGTIFRNSYGERYVAYLFWTGGAWHCLFHWLGNDWDSDAPAASLASA